MVKFHATFFFRFQDSKSGSICFLKKIVRQEVFLLNKFFQVNSQYHCHQSKLIKNIIIVTSFTAIFCFTYHFSISKNEICRSV